MTKPYRLLGPCCLLVLTAVVFAAQSAVRNLVIDGRTVSTEVSQQDGHYYVPVDIIANYFGYKATITDSQIALNRIAAPSNANGDPGTLGSTSMSSYLSSTTNVASFQTTPTITTQMGQNASVDGFDYMVSSIQDAGPKYTQMYDQRKQTVKTRFNTDSLAVVTIRETNRGTTPVSAMIPSANSVTVFNDRQVGFPATYIDARQSVDLSDMSSSSDYGYLRSGSTNVVLGPGGAIEFAVIANVPKGDTIQSVSVNVPARSGTNLSGAILMINRR